MSRRYFNVQRGQESGRVPDCWRRYLPTYHPLHVLHFLKELWLEGYL